MIQLDTDYNPVAKISVIGVGGGGGNAVDNMIKSGLQGVDFIVANTDKQAIEQKLASIKIHIGRETTRMLGAGGNPEVGRRAAEESEEDLREYLKGSDMVFVTAGMGGGTGTGAAPYIAKLAQDMGALVVGVVTKPFGWEGSKRIRTAEAGINELRQSVDALIVIHNHKLLDVCQRNTSFQDAFKIVDDVLLNATRGISDIISKPGFINVDFADVYNVMKGMGDALMGIGIASGDNRAAAATHNALNSPLLEGVSISGSQAVLVNITGGSDLGLFEVSEIGSIIQNAVGDEALIITGTVQNEEPSDSIMVTVVASGFNNASEKSKNDNKFSKNFEKQELFTPQNQAKPVSKPNTIESGRWEINNKIAVEPKNPIYDYENIDKSPSGNDELKLYDTPAKDRRFNKPLRYHGEPSPVFNNYSEQGITDKVEREQFSSPILEYDYDKISQKTIEKPAFLRRLMD